MSGLIGDLLDAGRIATGTLSVSTEPSEVGALVDRARNTFLAGGVRHTVHVDLPRDLPRVSVDRQRIVQVLNNLFANARQALSGVVAHPGFGTARGRSRRDLGLRQRPRHSAGAPPAPLPEVRRHEGHEAGSGWWTGPGHLQGAGRGPRRTHLGRRAAGRGPGPHGFHLHGPVWPSLLTGTLKRQTSPGVRRTRTDDAGHGRASSSWTTIRRRCAMSGERAHRGGLRRGRDRRSRRVVRRPSKPRIPTWSCWI